MFPYVSGSEGSKELPVNLVMLLTDFLNQLTRELHAFHAPCWGQNAFTYVYPHQNRHCMVWSLTIILTISGKVGIHLVPHQVG